MNLKALFFVSTLSFLLGSSMVMSRFGIAQFNPITFNGLRLFIASICFASLYSFRIGNKGWPIGRDLWRHSIFIGVMGSAIPMTATVASMQYQSSGVTSFLLSTTPAITVLFAHFLLAGERLNIKKIIGIIFALGGVLFLITQGESGLIDETKHPSLGYILALIAVLSISITTVYARRYMQTYIPLHVAGIRVFISAVILAPFSGLLPDNEFTQVNIYGWVALIYTSISGVFFATLLDFYNIQRFGATRAAMVSYLIPIVTGVCGMIILGEQITINMVFGICLVLVGVWIINFKSEN